MQKTAGQNAVSVITLRKYLAATGYKMPRGSQDDTTGSRPVESRGR